MREQETIKEMQKRGEVFCNKCEGRGCFPANLKNNIGPATICQKCQGYGRLDWVENVVGKRTTFTNGMDGTSFSSCTFNNYYGMSA